MAIKKLVLKIQGQGHGWGQNYKSQLGSNILSTLILLIPCQSTLLFLRYIFFSNLTFKIKLQSHRSRSHNMYNILSTHIPFVSYWSALPFPRCSYFKNWQGGQCGPTILSSNIPLVPCQSALSFLRHSIFKIWPWKSKVKVIPQRHKGGITPYLLISLSFHANRPSHFWDTAI